MTAFFVGTLVQDRSDKKKIVCEDGDDIVFEQRKGCSVMDAKKWPVLAQVLIALGCINGLRGIIGGWAGQSIVDSIFGIAGLIIFWSVYKFKYWALIGLTILLSLNILSMILNMFGGTPPAMGIIMVAFNGLIIYYFNSKAIKNLFAAQ